MVIIRINKNNMRPPCVFFSAVTGWTVSILSTLYAAPLIVGPGENVQLGEKDQPVSMTYDALTVETGGTLEVMGEVTINVVGDIRIDGQIFFRKPELTKANNGPPGIDGADGADDQPTGANAGSGGLLGGTGEGWTTGGEPRLVLNSQGAITIAGSIDLRPEFQGGDGGRGGHGGNGGSGISEPLGGGPAIGGFAGQAGSGGFGGFAGLPGANVRISGRRIDLRPGGSILLDNKGSGGLGGVGGNGGNGGRGGDGSRGEVGGGGGSAGSGGQGGSGGTGGILTLNADTIILEGQISLKGGPGGNGGAAGNPGNGGDAGTSTGEGVPGRRGGDAGNSGGSGPRGGRGGSGGSGGSLVLNPHFQLINQAQFILNGGEGGKGGEGRAVAIAKGGKGGGGTPTGMDGADSGVLETGADGAPGVPGRISVGAAFGSGLVWQVSGPLDCFALFAETNSSTVIRLGWRLCANQCYSTFINTGVDRPLELQFEQRWGSTNGTLEFSLADNQIYRVEAPIVLDGEFEAIRVVLDDPALRSLNSQEFKICLTGDGAQVDLTNVSLRKLPDEPPPSPEVLISRPGGGSTLEFIWTSVAAFSYQLQTRPSLTVGTWSNVGQPIPGTGSAVSASATIDAGQRATFYRVMVAP